MAREFSRPVTRLVRIRSLDSAIPDAEWIVRADEAGLSIRRAGARKDTTKKLKWQTILGQMLVFVK